MREMSVGEVVRAVGGKLNSAVFENIMINDISTDSRNIGRTTLFVPLRGERFDGHDYLREAVKVAACVFTEKPELCPDDAAGIVVENTLGALQKLANYVRLKYDIPVIAITGSNGKTTTKEILAAVLSEKYQVLKNEGNFNNEIGLPLTLLQLDENCQCAIVEMGMRGSGQITDLCRIAEPTAGIVTNVGETHIELLHSIDNIAKAKAELPSYLRQGQILALNADDCRVAAMAKNTTADVVLCGMACDAEVRGSNITASADGTSFDAAIGPVVFSCFLAAVGTHNVSNALLAVAMAWKMGLSVEQIVAGLGKYRPADLRMQIENVRGVTVIADCYNASPLSMRAALETLSLFTGRKIAMLADMLELGEHSEFLHRQVGEKAAGSGVDILLAFGQQARYIADAAQKNGVGQVLVFEDRDTAGKYLGGILQSGDVLLVKGSRGMFLEQALDTARKVLENRAG